MLLNTAPGNADTIETTIEGGGSKGRLIATVNGRQGTVCNNIATNAVAIVVCRRLGFTGWVWWTLLVPHAHVMNIVHTTSPCLSEAVHLACNVRTAYSIIIAPLHFYLTLCVCLFSGNFVIDFNPLSIVLQGGSSHLLQYSIVTMQYLKNSSSPQVLQ